MNEGTALELPAAAGTPRPLWWLVAVWAAGAAGIVGIARLPSDGAGGWLAVAPPLHPPG